MSRMPTMYRTFRYGPKNPVIGKVRAVLEREDLLGKKKRKILSDISGVNMATYDGWFEGDTRNPRHETLMATVSSLGYEEEFVKAHDIDLEKERKAGIAWRAKQKALREENGSLRKRSNGRAR